MNVDIRGDFSIAMPKVLGNSLNVKTVVNHKAGVGMARCVHWTIVKPFASSSAFNSSLIYL